MEETDERLLERVKDGIEDGVLLPSERLNAIVRVAEGIGHGSTFGLFKVAASFLPFVGIAVVFLLADRYVCGRRPVPETRHSTVALVKWIGTAEREGSERALEASDPAALELLQVLDAPYDALIASF